MSVSEKSLVSAIESTRRSTMRSKDIHGRGACLSRTQLRSRRRRHRSASEGAHAAPCVTLLLTKPMVRLERLPDRAPTNISAGIRTDVNPRELARYVLATLTNNLTLTADGQQWQTGVPWPTSWTLFLCNTSHTCPFNRVRVPYNVI